MNKTNTTAVRNACNSMMETLEGRQLRSATPAVVAYLPSYETNNAVVADLRSHSFRGITQVNFFNVIPTAGGVLPGTTVNGVKNDSALTASSNPISDLSGLVTDAHHAGVKVSVVVGGAGKDSLELTGIVNGGEAAWDTLGQSIGLFAQKYGVDGVDIDWEPERLASLDQQAAYGDMLAAVKAWNPSLQVSAAVAADKLDVSTGGKAFVLDRDAVAALDQVMVMDYDLEAGNVSRYARAVESIEAWGNEVTRLGGSRGEVIMGVPFYGTTGTSWATTEPETYAELVRKAGYVPSAASDTIVVNGVTWNHNGPQTIYNKTDYALDHGFGGMGIWSVGQDYLKNGQYDSTYSLLPQITKAVADNAGTTPTVPTTPTTTPTTPTTPTTTPTTPTTPTTSVKLTGEVLSSSRWAEGRDYTAENAFDGDLSTVFQAYTAGNATNPEWVGLQLTAASTLTQIKFAAPANAPWNMIGGVFQGANTWDFSDAKTLASVTTTPATGLNAISVTGTYRYVRYVAPAGAYGQIAELQVFGRATASSVRVAETTSPFAQSDKVITLIDGEQN